MSQGDSSSDINEHLPTVSADTAESPSTSTSISSGSIDTALLSDLDPSEINTRSISLHTWDLPVELTSTRSLQSAVPGTFTLHKRFFFEDGNITFLVHPMFLDYGALLTFGAVIQVDSILYRVHRYFLCRDSNEFVTRLSRLPAQEQASPPIISLENVKSKDFDAFLSILYPLCVLLARISTSQIVDPQIFLSLLGISIQRRIAHLKSCRLFWTYPLGGVLPAFAKWPFAV